MRVAQELKNNRDFIYQTNQALQNLGNGILSLSAQSEKLAAQFGRELKDMEIQFHNLEEKLQSKSALHMATESLLKRDWLQRLDVLEEKIDKFSEDFVHQELLQHKLSLLLDRINEIENQFDNLRSHVDSSSRLLQGKIQDAVVAVRKDLTPVIPKVDPVKKEIEEKLAAFYVDFAGLVKEIALLKKAVAYDEKKFENVYTLIERLKEGKK